MAEIPDEIKLFRTILDNPSTLLQLPVQLRYDKDFLELYYILLEDEIAPYIPAHIYAELRNSSKPKGNVDSWENLSTSTLMGDEEEIFHQLLQSPENINLISTDDKYDERFMELMYLVWGEEIAPYFPEEMFQAFLETEKVKRANTAYLKDYEEFATGITKQKRNAPN